MRNERGTGQAWLARLAAARYARAAGVALLTAAALAQVGATTLTTHSAPAVGPVVAGQQNSLTATPTLEQLLALTLLALVTTVPLAFFRPAMAAITVTFGNAVALAASGQVTAAGVAAELIAVGWLGLVGATIDLRAVGSPGWRTGRAGGGGADLGGGPAGGSGGWLGRHRGLAVTPGRYLAVGLVLPFLAIALVRSGWVAVFLAAAVPVAAGLGILAWAGRLARTRTAAGEALADTLLAHTARGERARIARELHDVVAHHISMIAVLAETGRLTTPGLPEAGARRFTEIGDTARAGLTEMRRLLGVLREDASAAEEAADAADTAARRASRQPQPGLAQLTELIDAARDASLAGTRLIISGPVTPLDPGVELAAYRIVQEALTNARRHAPGAAVDVELRYSADWLRLRVRDNGPGPVSAAAAPGSAGGTGQAASDRDSPVPADGPHAGTVGMGTVGAGIANGQSAGGGHGLAGMRERAFSVGGSLYAGIAPGGGFLIEAALPADRDQAGASRATHGDGGRASGLTDGAGGLVDGASR
jgi:signal transduction histidine kinase